MNEIVILNLADTHIAAVNNPLFEEVSNRFLQTLESYLKTPEGSDWHPNFICICGDIANHGQSAEYEKAKGFIEKICNVCSLNTDRIIMVPGNHDMQCRVKPVAKPPQCEEKSEKESQEYITLKKESDEYIKYIKQYFDELKTFWRGGKLVKAGELVKVFREYSLFRKHFLMKENTNYIPHSSFKETELEWLTGIRKFSEFRIAFWELNNTWCSLPKDYKTERRFQMKFGQSIIFDFQREIELLRKDNYLIISLFHHSFFKLDHEEYQPGGTKYCMYDKIVDLSDICLSGHEHGSDSKRPDYLRNSAQYFLNGAFFDSRVIEAPDASGSFMRINRKENLIEQKQFHYIPKKEQWEIAKTEVFLLHLNEHEESPRMMAKSDLRFKALKSNENNAHKQEEIIKAYFGANIKVESVDDTVQVLIQKQKRYYICFFNMDDWEERKEAMSQKIEELKREGVFPIILSCYASWEALEAPKVKEKYEELLDIYHNDILQSQLMLFMTKFEKV